MYSLPLIDKVSALPNATPEVKDGSVPPCQICLKAMREAKKLACGHIFHGSCLRYWLQELNLCPTCSDPAPLGYKQVSGIAGPSSPISLKNSSSGRHWLKDSRQGAPCPGFNNALEKPSLASLAAGVQSVPNLWQALKENQQRGAPFRNPALLGGYHSVGGVLVPSSTLSVHSFTHLWQGPQQPQKVPYLSRSRHHGFAPGHVEQKIQKEKELLKQRNMDFPEEEEDEEKTPKK